VTTPGENVVEGHPPPAPGVKFRRAGPGFGIFLLAMGAWQLANVLGLVLPPRRERGAVSVALDGSLVLLYVGLGVRYLRFRPQVEVVEINSAALWVGGVIVGVWGLLIFGVVAVHEQYGGLLTVVSTLAGAVCVAIASVLLSGWAGRRARG
jgi:hypothetical protein